MKYLLASLLFIYSINPDLFGQDPIQPFLDENSPKVLTVVEEEKEGGVITQKLIYYSRTHPISGDSTKIYAVISRPEKPGNYPGLLVLHGGGGSAEIEKVKNWASKGHIALSLDEPGIANPEKVPHSAGTWKSFKYGENRFVASPDVTYSVLFEGIVASIQGFYLLYNQPDVLKEKVGVVGISWGGYLTTMLSGLLSDHLCASFSVYGAGYYDAGSTFIKLLDKMPSADREIWLKYLDAGRRANHIKAPFFIAAASNDNWFYPPSVMKTLKAAKGPANHLFSPNDSHKITVPGGTGSENDGPGWTKMEEMYFDYYLKGKGLPIPKINKIQSNVSEKQVEVKFKIESETAIKETRVFYSFTDKRWTEREWKEVKAEPTKKGWFIARLPAQMTSQPIDCFAAVSDERPVTVSSDIITIK